MSRVSTLDNLTHTFVALTLSQTRLGRVAPGATAALVVASSIPDVDIVAAFSGGQLGYLSAHRGVTHGPLGVLGLGALVGGAVWAFEQRRGRAARASLALLMLVSVIGAAGHVLMDLPTSYGTRILSPFSWRWYHVDWMPIVDVYLWTILFGGYAACRMASRRREAIALAALTLMAADYGVRWAAHDAAMQQMASGGPRGVIAQAAIPTFLSPFRWRLVYRLSDGYLLAERNLNDAAPAPTLWFPSDDGPLVAQARTAHTARVFLDFSRFPAATARTNHDGGGVVRWDDMRFIGGLRLPRAGDGSRQAATERSTFIITVRVDANGRIAEERFGE